MIDSAVFNEKHEVPESYALSVVDGQQVKSGDEIAHEIDGDGVVVANMDGEVYLEGSDVYIRYENRIEQEYEIPSSARLMPEVYDGAKVKAGQQLTEGAKNPHRILRILGAEATEMYLLSEIQQVYRSQGVSISDKHFEIMIRKMLSKVQVTRSGSTILLPGELIDRLQLLKINEQAIAAGGDSASSVPVLLGITKAALSTDSFLSASSFQHTIKVLAGAAIEGKEDPLYGLKENVIIGKLIPAGTGFQNYQDRDEIAPKGMLEIDEAEYDYMDEPENDLSDITA